MKIRPAAVISILSAFVLLSCSESSFLPGRVDEPPEVTVTTLEDGVILAAGSEVPIRIGRNPVPEGESNVADALRVEILDHEGTLLAEHTYDSVDRAVELPPLRLPELQPGLYRLRTVYLRDAEPLTEQDVAFFIATGSYRIVGLTSYPASSHPEADGLVRVSLDVPVESDPYLVWVINQETVASGPLSRTGDTIAVVAPAVPGVFPIRVDLYPTWPHDAGSPRFPAPVSYRGELFVSNPPALSRTELSPRDSYFALYHFRGSFRDDGVRVPWYPSRDFTARPIGRPELVARTDIFGYLLDGRAGFRMDGLVWPAYMGEFSPVSITFRLLADELPAESELLHLEFRNDDLLTIVVDHSGRLGLRFAAFEQEIWSAAPLLGIGEPEMIAVSIVPGGEEGSVGFYSGGQLVSAHAVDGVSLSRLQARLSPGADRWSLVEGSTRIGATSGGFIGVIDEFGVFFRDAEMRAAINAALFLDSMRAIYGERLVYAASFDGDSPPVQPVSSGQVGLEDRTLTLGPGATVEFPQFQFENEDLIVVMEIARSDGAEARLSHAVSDELLAIVAIPESSESLEVEFRITHRDGRLTLTLGDEEQSIGAVSEGFAVVLTVAAPEAERAVLQLSSIVVRRDRPRIPGRLFNVSGE